MQQTQIESMANCMASMELEYWLQFSWFNDCFYHLDTQMLKLTKMMKQHEKKAKFQGMDFQQDPLAS